MTVAALLAGFTGWHFRSSPWGRLLIVVAVGTVNPLLGVAVGAGWFASKRWRAIAAQRRDATRGSDETLVFLDVVSLGATAGLSFRSAAMMAAGEASPAVAGDVRRAVARIDVGLDHGIGDGPIARSFDVASRSAVSGAALGDSLVALAHDERAARAAAERERIERLPVKLLFPLALLILPGFVLVTVVPAIISGIGQLKL